MPRPNADALRADARAVLASIGATAGEDFHTLTGHQVSRLIEAADVRRYRKPRGANGSRARYFYARMLRLARRTLVEAARENFRRAGLA